ncbi:hypothetical protein, partial [Streptomyces sp. WAC00303]|uniref:hypothetical protein n=1 Tax=Streptomyces sp. WAC00303 TaxID=2933779 RepID=UPI002049E737
MGDPGGRRRFDDGPLEQVLPGVERGQQEQGPGAGQRPGQPSYGLRPAVAQIRLDRIGRPRHRPAPA